MSTIRGQVAVVGVGHTPYARQLNRHSLDLIAEALQNALEDSGLRREEVDGLCTNAGYPMSTDTDAVAEVLGLNLRWYTQTWTHGRFCATVIQMASFAVHHGLANVVACVIGLTMGGHRFGTAADVEGMRETGGGHGESPHYGMTTPGAGAALAARRYFHRYGAGREDLAAVPMAIRRHALGNPNAIMRKPLTLEDYLNARYICEPLCLYDYCLVNDGGACLIITSAQRARDLKRPPVYLLGFQGLPTGRREFIFGLPGFGLMQQEEFTYRPDPQDLTVFRMSEVGPGDVDALYTYDAFSPQVWLALERFGFCGPGEAPAFCREGRIGPGGPLPVNTNGGLLSEAHLWGWGHQIEIVRQLRGEAGERQVPDMGVAMWANSYGDAIIYGR